MQDMLKDDNANQNINKLYYYQNPVTGKSSTTAFSTTQICRILCPVSSSSTSGVNSLIAPATFLLEFDSSTKQFSSEGWQRACQISAFKLACSKWYYHASEANENSEVVGPISTRELAALFIKKEITEKTQVWQIYKENDQKKEEGQSQQKWEPIGTVLSLLEVIQMFHIKNTDVNDKNEVDHMQCEKETYIEENAEQSNSENEMKEAQMKELEDFLNSTGTVNDDTKNSKTEGDPFEEEAYESDGGSYYSKEHRTGKWVKYQDRESYQKSSQKLNVSQNPVLPKIALTKKRKKKNTSNKFKSKNSKCWIYVTNLPKDTTEDEVSKYFSRAGILNLDPDTQRPKIKLYKEKGTSSSTDTKNILKGDASVCYARPESVEIALQVLDDSLFRPDCRISVSRAKFEQHGKDYIEKDVVGTSQAKRKVARMAVLQARVWDELEGDDFNNGRITGGKKGLRIIVLTGVFTQGEKGKDEDAFFSRLEAQLLQKCSEFGHVEKITAFSKHPDGVVIIKFKQAMAASRAIETLNGSNWGADIENGTMGRKIQAIYWDGITDYSNIEVNSQEDDEKRHEEFGNWLDNQELPEEFRVRVEGEH